MPQTEEGWDGASVFCAKDRSGIAGSEIAKRQRRAVRTGSSLRSRKGAPTHNIHRREESFRCVLFGQTSGSRLSFSECFRHAYPENPRWGVPAQENIIYYKEFLSFCKAFAEKPFRARKTRQHKRKIRTARSTPARLRRMSRGESEL